MYWLSEIPNIHFFFLTHSHQASVWFMLWKLWLEPDSGQEVERISVSNIPHAAEQHAFSHTRQVCGMSALSSYLSQNHSYKESAMVKGSNWVWGSLGLFIKLGDFHRGKSLLIKFSKFAWLLANSPLLRLLSGSWSTRFSPFQKPQLLESSAVIYSLTEGTQNLQFSSQMNLKQKIKINQNAADKEINF